MSPSSTAPELLGLLGLTSFSEIRGGFLPDRSLEIPDCYVGTFAGPAGQSRTCRDACRLANIKFGDEQSLHHVSAKDHEIGTKTNLAGAVLLAAVWHRTLEEIDCWAETDEFEGDYSEFDHMFDFGIPAVLRDSKGDRAFQYIPMYVG